MPITVNKNTAATTANILTGTDLQSAPAPGVLMVYCCSTQLDSVLTIAAPPEVVARSINPPQRANAYIDLSAETPQVVALAGGEQISVAITIVTAATVQVIAIFIED